jgi:hypothetical protein
LRRFTSLARCRGLAAPIRRSIRGFVSPSSGPASSEPTPDTSRPYPANFERRHITALSAPRQTSSREKFGSNNSSSSKLVTQNCRGFLGQSRSLDRTSTRKRPSDLAGFRSHRNDGAPQGRRRSNGGRATVQQRFKASDVLRRPACHERPPGHYCGAFNSPASQPAAFDFIGSVATVTV